ncbi:MAG: HAMP domain-containing protein, partial [Myxococcaceae bacterium]|nr:HAMP domain-containing protein [Myxococcaceae bacterium]
MSWFANLKLAKKLAVGTVFKVGPFLAVCIYLGVELGRSASQTEALFKSDVAALNAARDLRIGLIDIGRLMRMQHLAAKDDRSSFSDDIEGRKRLMGEALTKLDKGELSDAMRKDVESFREKFDDWGALVRKVVSAHESGDLAGGLALMGETKTLLGELEPAANRLVEASMTRASAKHAAVMSSADQARTILFAATIVAMLIAVFTVWRVTVSVTAPIDEMREKLVLVGEGDFTQRVDNQSTDEVGEVAAALNATLDKVSRALGEVRTVA